MRAELLWGPRDGEHMEIPDGTIMMYLPADQVPLPPLPGEGFTVESGVISWMVKGHKNVTYQKLGRLTSVGREAFGLVDERTPA